jgi:hypothetical protein
MFLYPKESSFSREKAARKSMIFSASHFASPVI